MVLQPASLAPCTKSITTFNKAAEHLGPRYTYNKNPFLPDSTNSTITSPYMLMKGGKKRRRRATKKMKRRTRKSKKRVHKKHSKRHSKSHSKRHSKRDHKSKRHPKRHTKKIYMRGGGHGGTPYGLPQSLVNMGREIEYGIKSLYESAVGGNTPVNPDPSIQPIGKAGSKNYLPALVDPEDAVKYAQQRVAKL